MFSTSELMYLIRFLAQGIRQLRLGPKHMWVLFGYFIMFSNFYQLDLHGLNINGSPLNQI